MTSSRSGWSRRPAAASPGASARSPAPPRRRPPPAGVPTRSFDMNRIIALATFLLVVTASAGWSQKLSDQPGYIPLEQLDLFPRDKLSVEINIDGALMRLIAAGAKGEDPEFSSLI